jgi:bifunctional NMN adenylyltransferase/nudix hydrolase
MENAMSEKKFDLLVCIGRFRPFHNGHKHVIDRALEQAHNVLVLVGSANRPRTFKNPWTYEEVRSMIHDAYDWDSTPPHRLPLTVAPLNDWMHDNDFRWLMNVHLAVADEQRRIQQWIGTEQPFRIGLVGFSKDHTSYYLKKFPQWGSVDVGAYKQDGQILNATDIRQQFLIEEKVATTLQYVPKPVAQWLYNWSCTGFGQGISADIRESVAFALDYKAKHKYVGGQNYEAIMTTVDSVVIQSGHVLLIKRKFNPGKGLWALPGGFGHANEWLRDANARERSEETRIKLSRNVLDLAFRFKHVFSDPNRSDDRGRIITHAYLHLLNDRAELPEVEADDDAEEVKWTPLGLMNPNEMYSDHFYIVHKLLDLIPVD